jgi:hypothetical protein
LSIPNFSWESNRGGLNFAGLRGWWLGGEGGSSGSDGLLGDDRAGLKRGPGREAANRVGESEYVSMNAIAGIALVLFILWVVLRVALAVTSGLLHLLWVIALVMLVFWVIGKLRGTKSA